MRGRGGCVGSFGHEHDFCRANRAENIDPRTNYAVKYATARGHLTHWKIGEKCPPKKKNGPKNGASSNVMGHLSQVSR